MRTLRLPSGREMPALGQGTWYMGENSATWRTELEALRYGLDLGLTLIDTAEMYGEGEAERLAGEAIAGRREQVFLVSKVYPHNASLKGAQAACHRSLQRLNTDYIDLYLLHWPGGVPLEETIEAFQKLKKAGEIRDYGISNFDLDEMTEACQVPGGNEMAANQVLYNLAQRGIEWDLMPWCREKGIPIMAYSPFEHSPREQKPMFTNPALLEIASARKVTPAQIALAWVLQQGAIAIPKAATRDHVRQNREALDIVLSPQELKDLDRAFPPPTRKVSLAMR
jgi:diketogulonate reductase-like aldo/keto reductase